MKNSTVKTAEKASAVLTKPEHTGLCMTCVNAPGCIYIKNQKSVVLQCEEFEGYTNSPMRATINDVLSKITSDASRADFVKYEGLCVNCEIRETCEFPKSEGGIWHCEEYQ
ncbi:MAG: hypothetical protein MUO85_09730 [candidate division Zixibacteria bacterium]|nr:hypothetical protein [candidate division Zixibacteria bacterium]